jgi:hypothetical protein
MSPICRRLPALVLLVSLGTVPSAPAAAPKPAAAEELLRFVPPDVAFCLVVRDLRRHAATLSASPFAKALQTPFLAGALAASPEWQKLSNADGLLQKYFQISFEQLRDDILGEAVVLAYRPGPPGKPEQEQGLLLIRAPDPNRLATLVDRINTVLKQSGELKSVEVREHAGRKYFHRVERKEENYYYLRGPVLVFSGQEAMIRRALAQEAERTAQESPVGRQLRVLGAASALASVWVNPRAFDADLGTKRAAASGAQAAFLKTFVQCWKALDGIALTFSLTTDIELGLTLRGRPDALPTDVRRFLDEVAGRSDLWARFPDDALFAAGARTSASALLALAGAFQTNEGFDAIKNTFNRGVWATVGRDIIADVLPQIGPDWGVCIRSSARTDKGWFPPLVFAVRVGAGDNKAPVDRALVDALGFWARLAVWGHNQKKKDPMSLKALRQDRLEVRYLASTRGEAMGLQPAYGLAHGYLVLASSPEAFLRFAATTPAPDKTGEVPLLRMSLKDLRAYLIARRQSLAEVLAEQHGLTVKEAGRNLDNLCAGLKFLDRLKVVQKTTPGQVSLTLRVRPSLPLRKSGQP